MQQSIITIIGYELTIGEVGLNEIVFKLKEIRDKIMLAILGEILKKYEDIVVEQLTGDDSGSDSKGLRGHFLKGNREDRCHGKKVKKRGFRSNARQIKTVFGKLRQRLRMVECQECGARYSPLLEALKIGRYARREMNLEHEVTEAVIDTNYRRLIDGLSVDISLGGIHNIVVGSDIDKELSNDVRIEDLDAVMADGTGVKQYRGKKGELKAVVGITKEGRVKPLGSFTNKSWDDIEEEIRGRLKCEDERRIPFIYDGEPGLEGFLSDIAESQRCVWHGPRGTYHSLWQDGVKKKESQPETDKVKSLIGIELPEGEFELLQDKDKEAVAKRYEKSKQEMEELVKTFKEKGYVHGASYLENLANNVFTTVKIWLDTGVIAPKTTSLLERVFRELGRRLKKIAWGWSDRGATNISKMILIKQYARKQWEEYWKNKLGINGYFQVHINSVTTA